MSWYNLHTHSSFCDGSSPLADYAASAMARGMFALGYSAHFPLPISTQWAMPAERLPMYLTQLRMVREKYRGDLEIYIGAEVDYIPGMAGPKAEAVLAANLDFTIGSIHFTDPFYDGTLFQIDARHIDFLKGLRDIYKYDIKALISRYYSLTREMVKNSTPNIVGHLDKIKMQNWDNQFFNERDPWYHREVMATLETIAQQGCILEVDTRGIYKRKSLETYPSSWVLEIAYELGIPVTISADAHSPDELNLLFANTADLLRKIGYTHLTVLKDGLWQSLPFNQLGIQNIAQHHRKTG